MNWNEITSKRTPVKTKDRASWGYVASEYRDSLLVIEGKFVSNEYLIPKSQVQNYDGKELSLRIRQDEMSQDFKI